jgi:hypothetical protein
MHDQARRRMLGEAPGAQSDAGLNAQTSGLTWAKK